MAEARGCARCRSVLDADGWCARCLRYDVPPRRGFSTLELLVSLVTVTALVLLGAEGYASAVDAARAEVERLEDVRVADLGDVPACPG